MKNESQKYIQSLKDLKLNEQANNQLSKKIAKQLVYKSVRKYIGLKIQVQDSNIYQTFHQLKRHQTSQSIKFIKKCLSNHFIFNGLSNQTTQYLITKLFYCQVFANQFIIKQNDNASSFFILCINHQQEQGKIDVLVNGIKKKEIVPGDGFGQLALLYNASRSASCQAVTHCYLWGIDRTNFRRILQQTNKASYLQNRKFLNSVKFFQNLSESQIDSITNVINRERFNKNDIIVNEGDSASSFYIIMTGNVRVEMRGKYIGKLVQGECFGENALLSEKQVRKMTVLADSPTTLLSLGRQSLKNILGQSLNVVIFRNKLINIFKDSDYFKNLTKVHISRLLDTFDLKRGKNQQSIVQPGQYCRNKIIIILEGQILINDKKFKYKNTIFGQQSLQQAKAKLKYNFYLTFIKKGSYVQITYNQIKQIIGGTYQQIISKVNQTLKCQKLLNLTTIQRRNKARQINLQQLIIVKKLGAGQFGSVFLVYSKQTKQIYALKCISKQQIIQNKLQNHMISQKKVMEIVNFPLIMQYIRSFKDQYNIYFLTEFIRGKQLFDVIRLIGLIPPKISKFYIASMILSIQYLHLNNIIYRDLKPQNIMITENGYLKMIDMGTCKIINKKQIPKTYTIIGTPHYMAPQMFSGKGYGMKVDLWAVGICLYQFNAGYVPFGQKAEDPYQIYEQILKNNLSFPNYFTDQDAKFLLKQLLSKTPETRKGVSYSQLKANPWFNDVDWDEIATLKARAPYLIPDQKLIDIKNINQYLKLNINLMQELKKMNLLKKPGTRKNFNQFWDKQF